MKSFNHVKRLVTSLFGSVAVLVLAGTAGTATADPTYTPGIPCCTLEAWIEGECTAVQPMYPECDESCTFDAHLEGLCTFCPCTEDYVPPPQEYCCDLQAWIEGKCNAGEPVCEECDPECSPEAAIEGLCNLCECPDPRTSP